MHIKLLIQDINTEQNICGVGNSNIKTIEKLYNTNIVLKGNELISDVSDDEAFYLESLFNILTKIAPNYTITERDIIYINKLMKEGKSKQLDSLYNEKQTVGKKFNGKPVYPKTINQKFYVYNLEKKDIIFGIGPAGTGKTYLAVVWAVSMLKKNEVKKLIMTRPAIEVDEKLGALPGDLKEKIDPYLRPLYDALYDTLGVEATNQLIEKGVIEIAPLAYMRGRTLENACIILDEAQNTTKRQMKMFLTRIGFGSKMIVTGDISQIDLPKGTYSGLIEAKELLGDIEEVGITVFDKSDVIRHPLVAKILERYERKEKDEKD